MVSLLLLGSVSLGARVFDTIYNTPVAYIEKVQVVDPDVSTYRLKLCVIVCVRVLLIPASPSSITGIDRRPTLALY